MGTKAKLENWSTQTDSSPYISPECSNIFLVGCVYGHSRFTDGKRISTSVIKAVDGLEVETRSGTKYVLGKVDPDYLEWLKEHRPEWDPENPITML